MSYIEGRNVSQFEGMHAGFSPRDRGIYLQHHKARMQNEPYHFHPAVEVNYLHSCDMTYSFSGEEVKVKKGHFCVFWGAHPHRSTSVSGDGMITNAFISLSEFFQWPLPTEFCNSILNGAVLSSKSDLQIDEMSASRWGGEVDNTDPEWQRLHALEVQSRLYRLALTGWDVLMEPDNNKTSRMIGGNAAIQFEKMLRFIAENFASRISIQDVADQANVSSNYALSLFRKMLGRTIKSHITDVRVYHAKMLLVETDVKILTIAMDCGFGSLSAFYLAFQNHIGMSPANFRRNSGRT